MRIMDVGGILARGPGGGSVVELYVGRSVEVRCIRRGDGRGKREGRMGKLLWVRMLFDDLCNYDIASDVDTNECTRHPA